MCFNRSTSHLQLSSDLVVIATLQKQFDDLLSTVQLAPSSYGLQPYQFIAISDPAVRRNEARRLTVDLKSVNWERGAAWAGIAGKVSPKGALSVGGVKETAYAVFSALADPATPGYKTVRGTATVALAA